MTENNSITRWVNTKDYFSPNPKLNMTQEQSEVMGLAFDYDSKYLAAGYGDGHIRFYNAQTGRLTSQCNIAQTGQEPLPVSCIKYRPQFPTTVELDDDFRVKCGSKTLLSVSCDGMINHWNALTGKLQHSFQQEDNGLFACDFSCDGLKYTVAGQDKAIYLYDELTRQLISKMTSNGIKLDGHSNRVFCTKFLPDDPNVCLTGSWDRIMKVYDTRAGRPVSQILGPLVAGDSIDVHGDEILAGSNRHKQPLAVYSLSMGRVMTEIPFDPPGMNINESGYVLAARFSKDRDRSLIFAGGAGRNELRAWDNDTDGQGRFKELGHLNSALGTIMCIDTAANGTQMAWGNHLGQVFISGYEVAANEEEQDVRDARGLLRLANKRSEARAAAAAQ